MTKRACPSGHTSTNWNNCSVCGAFMIDEDPVLTPESKALGVPEILEDMAKTFRERNAVYGDNWKMVGQLMDVMFPNGVHVTTHVKAQDGREVRCPDHAKDYDVWHLFELMIVKLSRFAISGLTHEDSVHDLAIYAAMIEAILKQRREQA